MQFTTDTESGVIVGVAVTNQGTDNAELAPMLEQLQEQHGARPRKPSSTAGSPRVRRSKRPRNSAVRYTHR